MQVGRILAAGVAALALVGSASLAAGGSPAAAHPLGNSHHGVSQTTSRRLGEAARLRVAADLRAVERQQQETAATARMVTLTGRVTDQHGHPLRDVEIAALIGVHHARTASTGRFTLRVPTGRQVVIVDGSRGRTGSTLGTGYVTVQRRVVADRSTTLPTVALALGGAISGLVTDGHGRPLEGAVVTPLAVATLPGYVPATDSGGISFAFFSAQVDLPVTDAHGRYRLTGLGPQSTIACYDDVQPGAPTGGDGTRTGYLPGCETRAVAPVPGRTTAVGTLALTTATAGFLRGRVELPDGRPARHIPISLNSGSDEASAVTDDSGRFLSPSLDVGRWHACPYLGFGSTTINAVAGCRTVTVRKGRTSAITIRLRRGASVSGTVTVAHRPAGGVLVELQSGSNGSTARSGRTGHFRAVGLAAGSYRVCVATSSAGVHDPTGVVGSCKVTGRLHLASGQALRGVDLSVHRAGAISGQLLGADGRPPTRGGQFYVTAGGTGAEVGAGGRFRLLGVRPGRTSVCVSALTSDEQTCRHDVPVRAGATTSGVRLTVPVSHTLVVDVRSASGRPLSGVDVAVLSACTAQQQQFEECSVEPAFDASKAVDVVDSEQSTASGRAVLTLPGSGHYAICEFAYYAAAPGVASPAGYADSCDAGFDATGSATSTTAYRTLTQAGAVTGRIVNASGRPVAGAHLVISHSAAADYSVGDSGFEITGLPTPPTPRQLAVTDAQGYYTIFSVASGSQTVCATGPRGSNLARSCLGARTAVAAGTTTTAPPLTMRSQ